MAIRVAIAKVSNRTAELRLGADVADAEAASGARKAAIGDERNLVTHALTIDRRRRGKHLAHAGAAARTLVADDQDFAFPVRSAW